MTNLTNNNDTYNGGGGDDVVNGRGGDDIINGNGGDDQINGGSDNDQVFGGAGDDSLVGGSGNDTLDGGADNDTFAGGSGDDTVVIHANAANGIASQSGLQLTLTTSDGIDTITSGVEHIQFDNVTIDILNGDALASLGIDFQTIGEEGSTVAANVLSNDIDIDDAITLTGIHSQNNNTDGTLGVALAGQYGSLTLNSDGSYSYTADPSTDALGATDQVLDTFTYSITSGGVTSTQTLTITINGENDEPTITSGVVAPTYNDTAGNDSNVDTTGTVTGTDPDSSDTLTYGITGGAGDDSLGGYDTSLAGDYGTLYINSTTGAYDYVVDDAAMEAAKTTDHDTFTFTLDDGNGGSDTQTFDVTINGVNDTPELAALTPLTYNDTAADDVFATQTGAMVGSDRDNDAITYRAIGQTVDHSQSGFNRAVAGTYGTLYLNINSGAYEYVANDSAIEGLKTAASDTFTLRVSDGTALSTTQTLTVNVNGVNDTPDVNGSTGADLTEAGGVLNGTAGTDTSFTVVTLSDRDTGDVPTFDGTALTTDGWSTSDVGATYTKTGTYGTATLTTATGHVDYQLNDSDSDTQGLNAGDSVQDTFTVWGTDGTAGNSTVIGFTIHGAADAAVVTGAITGDATEASGVANATAGSNATGDANNTDVDSDDADDAWQVVSTPAASDNGYGTYVIDATGNWTFTLNEGNATVQALNTGGSTTDTFTVLTADGTTQQITVTIHGANDAAVVTGTASDSVLEDGAFNAPGDPTASGDLLSTDVDNTPDAFQAVVSATASDNGYGTYTIDASGNWTYTLNDANAAVNALNDGDTLTDTFTALTEDGTEQVVTVTINGQNEGVQGTTNDDIMTGTANGDTFYGLGGNDIYIVRNTADKVIENLNAGDDLVKATVTYTLAANVEDLTLTQHANINGTGNGLDNGIIGNDANNTLSGLAGDDTLKGGDGNDVLIGGDDDDLMNGGAGLDAVSYATASAGVTVSLAITGFQNTIGAGFDKITNVERIIGSAQADTLTGNSTDNTLSAGAGNDTLAGGVGADTLTGGSGQDKFVYHTASESVTGSADTITDLTNNDTIDLSAVDPSFHIVGSFSNSAHELVLTFDGTNTTIAGDINGDGTADIVIIATGDHHTYTHFIL